LLEGKMGRGKKEPSPSPSIGLVWLGGQWKEKEKVLEFNLENVCLDKFLEEGRKDQLWSWREEGE